MVGDGKWQAMLEAIKVEMGPPLESVCRASLTFVCTEEPIPRLELRSPCVLVPSHVSIRLVYHPRRPKRVNAQGANVAGEVPSFLLFDRKLF